MGAIIATLEDGRAHERDETLAADALVLWPSFDGLFMSCSTDRAVTDESVLRSGRTEWAQTTRRDL